MERATILIGNDQKKQLNYLSIVVALEFSNSVTEIQCKKKVEEFNKKLLELAGEYFEPQTIVLETR